MLNINKKSPGVVSYVLSDPKFIEMGYTKLPSLKIMRRLNRYEMKPPDFPKNDWFDINKSKGQVEYDTGEKLARFEDDHYRLFYKNGALALDHYGSKENNVLFRTVVYSVECSEVDTEGQKHVLLRPTVLATFDDMGNGIVYDAHGHVRLEYNQSEGVVYDKTIGPHTHWKWHTLNEPPVLKEVLVDTVLTQKDFNIQMLIDEQQKRKKKKDMAEFLEKQKAKEDEEARMVALEKENIMRSLRQKHKNYRQFDIRIKAVKLNDQFSLHINRQASIFLVFQEGAVNLKFNVGLMLDNSRYVDSEFVEFGNYSNPMERVPVISDSLGSLQRVVMTARQVEKMRKRRASAPPVNPASSMDRMNALLSKPPQEDLPYFRCR